jgi:hypothetical protein
LALVLACGLLLGLSPLLRHASSASPGAGENPPPEPFVLRVDETGLTLEWRAPVVSQRPVTGDDGRPYVALEAPGWVQTDSPGRPQLLSASALAVVPPTGEVTLEVEVLESDRRLLAYPVVPAPRPVVVGSPPAGIEWVWARDGQAYADGSASGPWEIVTLEEAGWMRGRRLVRLVFLPLRFDPAGPALEVARRVRIVLRFQGEASGDREWAGGDLFTPLLQRVVVNPGQVVPFSRPRREAALSSPPNLGEEDSPIALSGTRASLAETDTPTDTEYLIIAHSDFITAVTPLAAHRAISDGFKVFTIAVQDVYAAYSGGVVTATAIRDYISDTYHSPPAPTLDYVLLVGDGTEDGSDGQYVPPYMITMDPPWSSASAWEAASDNRYVAVDGSDIVGDISIGRLPVNSVTETQGVVDKILSYDLNPPQWPWNERVLFFAGNEDERSGGQFHDDSDYLYSNHLPGSYTVRRVYFCAADCDQPYMYDDIVVAHDALAHDFSFGGLLVTYFGHSSRHQWAVDPETYAPLFHVDDVPGLRNGGALPVVLGMTCRTSRFAYPAEDTLDESMVRHEGGGAIATWGSTTDGRTSGHNVLAREFFDAVFNNPITVTRLGPATDEAKLALYNEKPNDRDLLDTFTILGDPATNLNLTIVPWPHQVFLPIALRDT